MRLFITVIKRKKHKATIIFKALPSYTCLLEDHREKHRSKKNKSDFGKDLSNEEKIFLNCEDAKIFYKEFHNGTRIVKGMLISTLFQIINLMSALVSFNSKYLHVKEFSIFQIWWLFSTQS